MKLPFFGKKFGKKAEESRGRGYVPTDRATELMSRGFSEIDAIDVLRREGFSPDEIDHALEQSIKQGVVGKSTVPPAPAARAPPPASPESTQGFQRLGSAYDQLQQSTGPTFPPRREESSAEKPDSAKGRSELKLPTIEELGGRTKSDDIAVPESTLPDEYYQGYPTEEYIDYVVQEQMQDVNERVNEFSIRYKELEKRMVELNERLRDMSKIRTSNQQQLISKIDSFSDSINDVNMRIASLEKAFKETLPALIESVRALSDLVQRMKREV